MKEDRLRFLLMPYVETSQAVSFVPPADLYSRLVVYLELLLRWNTRMNLTAVRNSEDIVLRHFGESLFAAAHLQPYVRTETKLLDLGSGAGFPGLPIQLSYPELPVMLAESRGKKAAFLREAVRILGLRTEVWPHRAEALPTERRFEIVTLRAVDRMEEARAVAISRLTDQGTLAELTVRGSVPTLAEVQTFSIPGSGSRVLCLCHRGSR